MTLLHRTPARRLVLKLTIATIAIIVGCFIVGTAHEGLHHGIKVAEIATGVILIATGIIVCISEAP